ncbi:hypothetical protein X777_00952 [Ooceraea biroi]|uniref:Uncharacterized protein n=1 Tax=Ooceraea biroi TaxID=2015173 RepID=A0A026WPA4_OOCBI|nr:hypothetical protein X777_00952 [Ooceraea biroi]
MTRESAKVETCAGSFRFSSRALVPSSVCRDAHSFCSEK